MANPPVQMIITALERMQVVSVSSPSLLFFAHLFADVLSSVCKR